MVPKVKGRKNRRVVVAGKRKSLPTGIAGSSSAAAAAAAAQDDNCSSWIDVLSNPNNKATADMRASLQRLYTALRCPLCGHLMTNEPSTLSCSHTFCKDCIDAYVCDNWDCPVEGCGMPVSVKGERKGSYRQINPSIQTAVTSLTNIGKALYRAPDHWWKGQNTETEDDEGNNNNNNNNNNNSNKNNNNNNNSNNNNIALSSVRNLLHDDNDDCDKENNHKNKKKTKYCDDDEIEEGDMIDLQAMRRKRQQAMAEEDDYQSALEEQTFATAESEE